MMMRRFCCTFAVATVVGCVHFTPALAQEPGDEEARAAVKALVDKINLAWKAENPASLFQQILSDKSFAFALPRRDNPSEARVLNKQTFCKLLEESMAKERPRKHDHRVKAVTVLGPLAYELGTTDQVTAEGVEQRTEILNVFAKDETGWKLVFSTFADHARKALRADSTDKKALRKLAQEFVGTFCTENPSPFKRLEDIMADDIVGIMSTGRMLEGKQDLLHFYKEMLAEVLDAFRTFKVVYHIRSVRVLGDGATVFGKLTIEGQWKESKEPIQREVWETLVFRKDAAGWRLIQEHSTTAAAEDSATRKE